MVFIITGFTQDKGYRVFGFDGIGPDRVRMPYVVRTDLSLIRKYGIQMQELPLLCRGLLERQEEGQDQRLFTFTEADMSLHATDCAAVKTANALKKKAPRRPPTETPGASWRAPQIR